MNYFKQLSISPTCCTQIIQKRAWINLISLVLILLLAPLVKAQQGGGCSIGINTLLPATGATVDASQSLNLKIDVSHPNTQDCRHVGTGWQVATDPSFALNSLVVDKSMSTVIDLTTTTIQANTFQPGVTYYWRALLQVVNAGFFETWDLDDHFQTASASGGACNPLPLPLPLSPADGVSVSMTPTLKLVYNNSNNCTFDGTIWWIGTDANMNNTVASFDHEIAKGHDPQVLNIPGGTLQPGVTYYWQTVFYLATSPTTFGPQSVVHRFTTQGGAPVPCAQTDIPQPFAFVPQDGATVAATVRLEIGALVVPCTLDGSFWELDTDPNFPSPVAVFDREAAKGHDLYLLDMPGGTLQPGVTYYWRVTLYVAPPGAPTVWGASSVSARFTTAGNPNPSSCGALPTPNVVSPANGASGLSLTPTLRISDSNAGNCIDGALWWVAKDAQFSTVVYSVDAERAKGFDPLNVSVPAGTLQSGETYYWQAIFYRATTPTTFGTKSPVVRFTTDVGGGGGSNNQPPVAKFSYAPATVTVNQNVTFTNQSSDPDGSGDIAAYLWDFGDGVQHSAKNPSHTFSKAGTYTVQLSVTDKAGHKAIATKTIQVADSGGGSSILSIDQVVARMVPNDPAKPNADSLIGDQEIIMAIQHWILSSTVANTNGQKISDVKMLELVKKWVMSATVTQSADASMTNAVAMQHLQRLIKQIKTGQLVLAPEPFTLHAVYMHPLSATRWALKTQGQGIERLRIQVFDTAGRLVMDERAQGQQLQFSGLDRNGQRLANGVYLYLVTVYDVSDTPLHGKLHKLVMLR